MKSSSETQGRLAGARGNKSGKETKGRRVTSQAEKVPGNRLLPDHFQTALPMLPPDWAEKSFCSSRVNRFPEIHNSEGGLDSTVFVLISRGGTPRNSWWGCAARVFKSRPYFKPKHAIFHTRFQTWHQKFIPVFRPELAIIHPFSDMAL